jgi:DNA polymerase IV
MATEASDRSPGWILHLDLDQFIAAVEILRRPELRGKPVIVGGAGDPNQRRAVVATASYEAREHGVHSGMPIRTAARKSPDAVFLATDAPAYEEASAQVMATLRRFPVVVEVLGWDEAFMAARTAEPEALAREIQQAVLDATGLHSSVGIGDNKHRAKLATGFAKPAGIFRLTADEWEDVMFARPVTALWGIGPKMARNLAELGIATVADLAAADPAKLTARFGPTMGPYYWRLGHGAGGTRVDPAPRVPRSHSRSETYPDDLTDRAEVAGHIATLARELAGQAVREERDVKRVAVTVRYAPFFTKTRIKTLPAATRDAETIVERALEVLDRFDGDRPIRLLGVRVEFTDP